MGNKISSEQEVFSYTFFWICLLEVKLWHFKNAYVTHHRIPLISFGPLINVFWQFGYALFSSQKLHFSDISNVQTRITFDRIVISAYSFYISDAKHVS